MQRKSLYVMFLGSCVTLMSCGTELSPTPEPDPAQIEISAASALTVVDPERKPSGLSIPGVITTDGDRITKETYVTVSGVRSYFTLEPASGGRRIFAEMQSGGVQEVSSVDDVADQLTPSGVAPLSLRVAPLSLSNYVQNIQVIAGTYSTIPCPSYYRKASGDLNQVASGKYIYLCVTFEDSLRNPSGVFDLSMYNSGSSSTFTMPYGFYAAPLGLESNGDLNQGAGGDYIWFIPRSGSDRLIGLGTTAANYPNPSCDSGWARITETYNGVDADLNKGAGGYYIYLCTRS